LLRRLTIEEPPGRTFHYNAYNSELLGLILERTTHRSPSHYLQEKVWIRLGMEYPATWSIDSKEDGLELMQSALNARAIDFAKFGRLYLDRGNWNGQQIISERWVDESTSRDPQDHRRWEIDAEWAQLGGYYKYAWWGLSQPNGEDTYLAAGKYGQYIFVSPRTRVVIVRTAKWDGLSWLVWPRIFQGIANQVGQRAT
jgi:CubicO group peptidase (beta-lactamase class C family)